MQKKNLVLFAIFNLLFFGRSVFAVSYEFAVLQALDKVTAQVTKIRVRIGDQVPFGTLRVLVRHCDKRPPEENPESAAFVEIYDTRTGRAPLKVFKGWMFASSPALSALEHPVYDIWVLDCNPQ